jgi:predicted nucleic acid-binding protein
MQKIVIDTNVLVSALIAKGFPSRIINAEFLITGNTLDFTFDQFKNVKIVTPREYWENHKPK